jgi:1-(5-phosphoribosyl)-5-[(5-phosphoribosylamino)methylideneamino] imidazole-4-carboxamide isomerase/N-(5'phosphoribosyl)anthranilate isomerase
MSKVEKLDLLPALDVKGGRSVRISLAQDASETSDSNPLEVAQKFLEMGATWLHLVDLDAAYGSGTNRELLFDLIANLDLKVQLSGGIKDIDSLEFAMSTKCVRANIGTTALVDMNWVGEALDQYGERLVIGLDVQGRDLLARGSNILIKDFTSIVKQLDKLGARRYVVTDVNKDGSLGGPNLQLLDEILEITNQPIVWSGGVSNLNELESLRMRTSRGLEGVIIGKAFYEGELFFPDALGVCSR